MSHDRPDSCVIHLIRHGESLGNVEQTEARVNADRPLGTSLSPRGVEQARALADRLRAAPLARVFASDLLRASETAAIIAEPHGLTVQTDALLREIDATAIASLPSAERAALTRRLAALSDHDLFVRRAHPAVESYEEAARRIEDRLIVLATAHHGREIAVVSHGGAIRALLVRHEFATIRQLPGGSFPNCAALTLDFDGEGMRIVATHGWERPDPPSPG